VLNDISSRNVYNLGVLVSHNGSNFQAIIDACKSKVINATVALAISNNSKSHGLVRARSENIPALHLSSKTHPQTLDDAILSALEDHDIDLVVTAGYMKKLGPKTLKRYRGKIINIHPALLPKYGGTGMYGLNVHKAVLASRDKETGITVHYVDGSYDTGEIISQTTVKVISGDTPETLAARVIIEEHKLLVHTLKSITG
jgi:phosphoribosylglycinamide formyltransferase-1